MVTGSDANPGPSFAPSPSPGQLPKRGAHDALQDARSIGRSLDTLVPAKSSPDGGACCCEMATYRLDHGPRGAWKNTSWVPVTCTPSLPSLRRLPGRAWMCSVSITGYLECVNCGGRSAVVSAELSGSVVLNMLPATSRNIAPKGTKLAR